MDTQPEEIIFEQALLMQYDDIINICKTNSTFKRVIYDNPLFWRKFAGINSVNENFNILVQDDEKQVDVIITIRDCKLLIVIDKQKIPTVNHSIDLLVRRKRSNITINDVDNNYYEISLNDSNILNIQFFTKYDLNISSVSINYTKSVERQLKKIA